LDAYNYISFCTGNTYISTRSQGSCSIPLILGILIIPPGVGRLMRYFPGELPRIPPIFRELPIIPPMSGRYILIGRYNRVRIDVGFLLEGGEGAPVAVCDVMDGDIEPLFLLLGGDKGGIVATGP
jgi:hypothetical protein